MPSRARVLPFHENSQQPERLSGIRTEPLIRGVYLKYIQVSNLTQERKYQTETPKKLHIVEIFSSLQVPQIAVQSPLPTIKVTVRGQNLASGWEYQLRTSSTISPMEGRSTGRESQHLLIRSHNRSSAGSPGWFWG